MDMRLRKAFILPDVHHPFAGKAYDLALKVAEDIGGWDELVLLGDFCDFYSISSHAKDPSVDRLLRDEIEECNKALDVLEGIFDCSRVYLEGNHEARLNKFLARQAGELFGVPVAVSYHSIPATVDVGGLQADAKS